MILHESTKSASLPLHLAERGRRAFSIRIEALTERLSANHQNSPDHRENWKANWVRLGAVKPFINWRARSSQASTREPETESTPKRKEFIIFHTFPNGQFRFLAIFGCRVFTLGSIMPFESRISTSRLSNRGPFIGVILVGTKILLYGSYCGSFYANPPVWNL